MRTNRLISDIRSGNIRLHKEAVDPKLANQLNQAMSDIQYKYEELMTEVTAAEKVFDKISDSGQRAQFRAQLDKLYARIKSRL